MWSTFVFVPVVFESWFLCLVPVSRVRLVVVLHLAFAFTFKSCPCCSCQHRCLWRTHRQFLDDRPSKHPKANLDTSHPSTSLRRRPSSLSSRRVVGIPGGEIVNSKGEFYLLDYDYSPTSPLSILRKAMKRPTRRKRGKENRNPEPVVTPQTPPPPPTPNPPPPLTPSPPHPQHEAPRTPHDRPHFVLHCRLSFCRPPTIASDSFD